MKAFSALLAMTLSALGAPSDPGETAVRFLEKVRSNKLDLAPGTDTALSPHTSEKKREEIARRLDRIAKDLGSDPLEVGAVKLDGDFAAVLIRKIGGFDPSKLQVFPVALVKRGAGWTAAPVPASFENAGVGYADTLRKRLGSLEEWMLRQRVFDLETLREESTARMRRKVEESLSVGTLRALSSQQVGERFVSACENRRLPEVLGLLGGLTAILPEDWSARLRTADAALTTDGEVIRPWRLLVAPEVLRVPVFHEEDIDGTTAMLSIACLDPAVDPSRAARSPKVELVHLALSKSEDGLWRIDPPSDFLMGTSTLVLEPDENLDGDLLDLFPAKLATRYPASPGKTAGEACEELLRALVHPKPSAWVRLIRIQGEPSDIRAFCARAAKFWWEIRGPATARLPTALAFHENDDHAVAVCQFFDPRNPDRLELRFLYFEKTPGGWLWDVLPSDETRDSLQTWTDAQALQWQDNWQETLLIDCPVLDQLPVQSSPSADESRKAVESWLKAIRDVDLRAALRLTTRLDTPDSRTMLLRNLGFEFTGARMSQHEFGINSVNRGDFLTAVGAKLIVDGKPSFPLYPVVTTPKGPRILLEVDLLATENRTREYLNQDSIKRMKIFSAAAADELKKLFSAHLAAAKELLPP